MSALERLHYKHKHMNFHQTENNAFKKKCSSDDFIFKCFVLQENDILAEDSRTKGQAIAHASPQNNTQDEPSDDIVFLDNQIIQLESDEEEELVENQGEKAKKEGDSAVENEDKLYLYEIEDDEEKNQPVTSEEVTEKFDMDPGQCSERAPQLEEQSRKFQPKRKQSLALMIERPPAVETPIFSQSESRTEMMQNRYPHQFVNKLVANRMGWPKSLSKIKGIKLETKEVGGDKVINIVNKPLFASSCLPCGFAVRCLIKRSSSFFSKITPEFDLYLTNGLKHIMSARKAPFRNREVFKFSTEANKFDPDHINAVLHANVEHNLFWLVDKPSGWKNSVRLLLVIHYSKKEGTQERLVKVLSPKENIVAIPYNSESVDIAAYERDWPLQLYSLQSRSIKTSTKNFQLVDEDEDEYRFVTFNKQSDNMYQMAIYHPLTPLQAFAVAMTRFDAQLN